MESSDSPQSRAVGEDLQNLSDKRLISGNNPSYAAMIVGKNSAEKETKLELNPVDVQNGTPTVEFTVDEVNSFTREEGLHQAVIFKFSYGKPAIHKLRQILPSFLDIKGKCNIGLLEHRHILVRFDLLDDFVNVVSRASGYVRYRRDDFFFRTFPWTMDFNPREETSKAVVWISFPDLPANLFTRKSLMSIASAVGKPLAVDKATNDRTRPSTARVKVLINLIDKHPKIVKIKVVDMKSGNLVEYDQKIVVDNLPKYCTYCRHQGHDKKVCRWISEDCNDKTVTYNVSESKGNMPFSGRDARELLNEIKANRRGEMIQISGNKEVAKNNADDAKDNFAEAVQCRNVSNSVNEQQIEKSHPQLPLAATPVVIQQNSATIGTSFQQAASTEQLLRTGVESADESIHPNGIPILNANIDSVDKTRSKLSAEVLYTQASEKLIPQYSCFGSVHIGTSQDTLQTYPTVQQMTAADYERYPTMKDSSGSAKQCRNTVSLNSISMVDFQLSRANSTFEIGPISGVKISDGTESTPEMQQSVSGKASTKIVPKSKRDQAQVLHNTVSSKVVDTKVDQAFTCAQAGQYHSCKVQQFGAKTCDSDSNEPGHLLEPQCIVQKLDRANDQMVQTQLAVTSSKVLPAGYISKWKDHRYFCANLKRERENTLKQLFLFENHRNERVIKDAIQSPFIENFVNGKLKTKWGAPDFIPSKPPFSTCIHVLDTPPKIAEGHIGTSKSGAILMRNATWFDKKQNVRQIPMRAAKQKQANTRSSSKSNRSKNKR